MAIEDGGWAFQRLVGRQVHVQVEQMLLLYNTLHACRHVWELPSQPRNQDHQHCRNSDWYRADLHSVAPNSA